MRVTTTNLMHPHRMAAKAAAAAGAVAAVAALLLFSPFPSCASVPRHTIPESAVQGIIAKVSPSIIRIRVVEASYRDGREVKEEASGSGVIISPDGYAVTNHHVAGEAVDLIVTMSTKEELPAKLVGTDPLADIAVIKLKSPKPRRFPYTTFGDSSQVRVGDPVLAIGSPLSLSQSTTMGIISNTEMIMPEFLWPFNKMELSGEDVGSMVRWLGHDARIAGGNSGGPLVDMHGQVIGINEIQMGLSGAIPSSVAKQVAQQIIKTGTVRRSWLGVQVQPLLKSSGKTAGVLVSDVMKGSPASKAGIRTGDLIRKVAGKPVSVRFGEQVPLFNQMVASLPVGKPVSIQLERAGKALTVKPVTTQREPALPREKEMKAWGLTVRNISKLMARERGLQSTDGTLVTSLGAAGAAADAKPSLQEGDIIVAVAGKPVASVQQLQTVTADLTKGKKERVPALVEFRRKSERYMTVVRLGKEPLRDPGLEASKAWLPIGSQVLTEDLADSLGIPGKTGVRVTEIYKGHSAEKAGLKVGDIVVGLDGETIEASQPQDYEVLAEMVRQKTIGDPAELSVIRGKQAVKLTVTLEPSPKLPREMKRYRDDDFDFTARDITFIDQDRQSTKQQAQGVYIESVDEGGWAAVGRLAVGDIVMAIDGKPLKNVADLEDRMAQIKKEKHATVVFQVRRSSQDMYVEIQPGWQK